MVQTHKCKVVEEERTAFCFHLTAKLFQSCYVTRASSRSFEPNCIQIQPCRVSTFTYVVAAEWHWDPPTPPHPTSLSTHTHTSLCCSLTPEGRCQRTAAPKKYTCSIFSSLGPLAVWECLGHSGLRSSHITGPFMPFLLLDKISATHILHSLPNKIVQLFMCAHSLSPESRLNQVKLKTAEYLNTSVN